MPEGKTLQEWLASLSLDQIKWISATLETVIAEKMTEVEINKLIPILKKEFLMRSVKLELMKGGPEHE